MADTINFGYNFGAPLNENILINTSTKYKISILSQTLASIFHGKPNYDYSHSKKTPSMKCAG